MAEPGDLSLGLVGYGDRAVALRPEFLAPAVEPPELAGDVGVDELHEVLQLELGLWPHEHVVVIREENDSIDLHSGHPLCSADRSPDRHVDDRRGLEQETTVERSSHQLNDHSAEAEP